MPEQDPDAIAVLRRAVPAIVESVQAAGPAGAPGGIIYAGLAEFGCTLQNYETIMATLVDLGKLRRQGDLYFAIEPA